MKKTLVAVMVSAVAISAIGLTENEEESLIFTGGILDRPAAGFVSVVNYQDSVKTNVIAQFLLPSGQSVQLPFRYFNGDGKFSVEGATAALEKTGGNVAIFVVDDPTLPMSLCATEARWGVLNLAPLKVDNPKSYQLAGRADRMFTRVCMQVMGGGSHEDNRSSAMKPATSLADIDGLKSFSVPPMAMMYMGSYARKVGIRPAQKVTYEAACVAGWAPAPTNKYQQAIWDEIHKLPANPLTIMPETKPVKK